MDSLLRILKKMEEYFCKIKYPQLISAKQKSGTTKEPFNKERSVGGSSGGEGTLIASKCSPIGIGIISAGSIRIPWHFENLIDSIQ